MEFDTPKGKMTFRKEDHQALQSMYVFKIKADRGNAWDVLDLVREIPIVGHEGADPQQTVRCRPIRRTSSRRAI